MESHLDSNQIADLTADLNVHRLRSRTGSLLAATQRLLEEIDRSIAELEGPHLQPSRLRPDVQLAVRTSVDHPSVPKLGRSGVPQALTAIYEGAERLQGEVDRVRADMSKHAELLRGTDLGDDAQSAVSLGGAFVLQLLHATAQHDPERTHDSQSLDALADALRNAISILGDDYASDSAALRRPTATPHKA